jgi:hypothetical protein
MVTELTRFWILEVRSWSCRLLLDMMFILIHYLELDLLPGLVSYTCPPIKTFADKQEW